MWIISWCIGKSFFWFLQKTFHTYYDDNENKNNKEHFKYHNNQENCQYTNGYISDLVGGTHIKKEILFVWRGSFHILNQKLRDFSKDIKKRYYNNRNCTSKRSSLTWF